MDRIGMKKVVGDWKILEKGRGTLHEDALFVL